MRYAQLVIGPAGCGKSTYCETIQTHGQASGRLVKVVNLDPAAESFKYDCCADIRELVTVHDVMEELGMGPNGGLIEAMEYLMENSDWLEDRIDGFVDDDYILFDCPGQIELFTHIPIFHQLAHWLELRDFRVASVFCIDVSFLTETTKFIAGVLTALSAMIRLELPHINVLTKCDLVDENDEELAHFLDSSPDTLMEECKQAMPDKFRRLNEAMCQLLTEYQLVSLVPLNCEDEESIQRLCHFIDNSIQYGEDLEPKANFDMFSETGG